MIVSTDSPDQTHALGARLGRELEPGDVVGLVGELGAGKTALVVGVAEGMGVAPEVYVSSPSFTLVNEYPGRFPLIHADFYRLDAPDDLVEIGVEEHYRSGAACLVEWFDRFPGAEPPEYLVVVMTVTGDSSRRLEARALGRRHNDLARRWLGGAVNA